MADRVCAAHFDFMRWRNYAASTIQQRRYTLGRLERHAGTLPLYVDHEHILSFRDRLTKAGRPLSIAAQAAELAHLNSFYRWCVLEGYRDDDPMTRVPRPKTPLWLPHPIGEDELNFIISTARERIRPFYFLSAFAGLRACEISRLRGEDLWWHMDPPLLVVTKGKGGDPGTVPIGPVLRDVLEPMPQRGWLFPKLDGSGPLLPHSISHLANDHMHRCGSSHTLHSLRHRFGTLVYRLSGGDIRLTQEMMRHRSPVSTAVYTQVDQSEAAGVVGRLPHLRAVS